MIIKNVELEIVCGITSKIPDNRLPEIAFAGKSNVGKSSLINTLMNRKALARISAQPGKTQTINFYNINQMLTNDYETKVTVNKRELLDCIDRATLLLREAENKPVIMNVKNDEIKMEMNTKIGSMDENIGIQKKGKDLRIAFDPKFLIDVLRVIDEEEVNLYLFNAKAPCFIRDDNSYIYLILPVNLIDN